MCVWTKVQDCADRGRIVLILPACAMILLTGCQLFEQPVASATQPALNWLAHFGAQDGQQTVPIDLNSIRPAAQAVPVQTGDLLEITVSNLFQPEEPHTFPARIKADGMIEVPLLGSVAVAGQTRENVESQLIYEFQQRELLVDPTIIVRNLEVPQVKIYVEGAVEKPGMIPLPREDASVYAALVSAGGLKSNAGSHISIARRLNVAAAQEYPETAALFSVEHDSPHLSAAGAVEAMHSPPGGTMTKQTNRSSDNTSRTNQQYYVARKPTMADVLSPDQMRQNSGRVEYEVIWFDAHREDDRRTLVEMRLSDGDIVSVSEVSPPIQVTGAVKNPGSYNIPDSDSVTLIDALKLAGDVKATEVPLAITLVRPGGSGWPGRRWTSKLDQLEANPSKAPVLRPGDIIHVEQSTGNTLKQAVQGWLGK